MELLVQFFYRNKYLGRRAIKIGKSYLCDMKNANACQKRAPFVKTENIGPRWYAVYKCPKHGEIKIRLNELAPEEINKIRLAQAKAKN